VSNLDGALILLGIMGIVWWVWYGVKYNVGEVGYLVRVLGGVVGNREAGIGNRVAGGGTGGTVGGDFGRGLRRAVSSIVLLGRPLSLKELLLARL